MEINNKYNIGDKVFVTSGTQINICKIEAIKVYKDMIAYELEYLKHPNMPNQIVAESEVFESTADAISYITNTFVTNIKID